MPYAVGFFFVEHKPRLLYVWVSGKGARLMDDVTDDEVFDQTVEMLYNLLSKNYNVSRPTAMIRYHPSLLYIYFFYFNLILTELILFVGVNGMKINISAVHIVIKV